MAAIDEVKNTAGCEEWLMMRVGFLPRNSLGYFRAGIGFYNKKEYIKAIECFQKSVELDKMNVKYRLTASTMPIKLWRELVSQ